MIYMNVQAHFKWRVATSVAILNTKVFAWLSLSIKLITKIHTNKHKKNRKRKEKTNTYWILNIGHFWMDGMDSMIFQFFAKYILNIGM